MHFDIKPRCFVEKLFICCYNVHIPTVTMKKVAPPKGGWDANSNKKEVLSSFGSKNPMTSDLDKSNALSTFELPYRCLQWWWFPQVQVSLCRVLEGTEDLSHRSSSGESDVDPNLCWIERDSTSLRLLTRNQWCLNACLRPGPTAQFHACYRNGFDQALLSLPNR